MEHNIPIPNSLILQAAKLAKNILLVVENTILIRYN
jgi:hypothetical protein